MREGLFTAGSRLEADEDELVAPRTDSHLLCRLALSSLSAQFLTTGQSPAVWELSEDLLVKTLWPENWEASHTVGAGV